MPFDLLKQTTEAFTIIEANIAKFANVEKKLTINL